MTTDPLKPTPNAAACCPECGNAEMVKAKLDGWFSDGPGARCLVCGHRFRVSDTTYEELRHPQVGEPFQRYSDFRSLFMRTALTAAQLIGAIIGLIVAGILILWLPVRLTPVTYAIDLLSYLIIAACVYAGWTGANWLFPPPMVVPGKCDECGYDLRGTTSGRCPECGTEIEDETADRLFNDVRLEFERPTDEALHKIRCVLAELPVTVPSSANVANFALNRADATGTLDEVMGTLATTLARDADEQERDRHQWNGDFAYTVAEHPELPGAVGVYTRLYRHDREGSVYYGRVVQRITAAMYALWLTS